MRKRAMGLELTITKSNVVRVDNEKTSDGVRVHNEKERCGDISL